MSKDQKNTGNQPKPSKPEVKGSQQRKDEKQKEAGKPSGKPAEKKSKS